MTTTTTGAVAATTADAPAVVPQGAENPSALATAATTTATAAPVTPLKQKQQKSHPQQQKYNNQQQQYRRNNNNNNNNNNGGGGAAAAAEQRAVLLEISSLVYNRQDATAMAIRAILDTHGSTSYQPRLPTASKNDRANRMLRSAIGVRAPNHKNKPATAHLPPPPPHQQRKDVEPKFTDSDHPWQREVRAQLRLDNLDRTVAQGLLMEAEKRQLTQLSADIRRRMRQLESSTKDL